MNTNLRIIKIVGDKIYLTPNYFITFNQTNFPADAFKFSPQREFFWEVELKQDTPESNLIVWVNNFESRNVKKFQTQQKRRNIKHLVFHNLSLDILTTQMIFLDRKMFMDKMVVDDSDRSMYKDEGERIYHDNEFERLAKQNVWTKKHEERLANQIEIELIPPEIVEEISFRFKFIEAVFHLGLTSFSKFIKQVNQKVEFKIYNDEILPEYEHIKSYFPKAFKRKTFNVEATLKLQGKQLIDVTANSSEIEAINAQVIDSVKRVKLNEIKKVETSVDLDKGLYSLEELMTKAQEKESDKNIFINTETDLINLISEEEGIRNKEQLSYLAGDKQSSQSKIYFTLKPMFGFLFSIIGETMYHFCWELLDSHATYIWSIEKYEKINYYYKEVEMIINDIRLEGRSNYKKGLNSQVFNYINHSTEENGFTEWKHKLNEVTKC